MLSTGPIMLGLYRPLDSYLHRLDARAKILPITLVMVLALFSDSYFFYIGILAILIAGLLASGIDSKDLLRSFRPVFFLLAITIFYHLVFSGKGTPVLVSVGGFDLRLGAVQQASFYSLRLVLFISIAFLVTLTSSPSELADAFTRLLRPLEKLRVPVSDLGLIMFMAIRFIPILYQEFVAIRNAQMIRGVRFSGSLINRIRKTFYIILPVFVAAIQRADELAVAIEARGYGRLPHRTCYGRSRMAGPELLFLAATFTAVAGLFVITG